MCTHALGSTGIPGTGGGGGFPGTGPGEARAERIREMTPSEREALGFPLHVEGGRKLGYRDVSRLSIRGLRELNARARADLKIPFTPVGPDFNKRPLGERRRELDVAVVP